MPKVICNAAWLLIAIILMQNYNCDLNNDGIVDIFDLTFVAANLDTSLAAADVNRDGLVDIFDIVLVAYAYGDVYRSENKEQKIYLPIILLD